MKKDDDKFNQANNETASDRISESSIFSEREIKTIVKDFIAAYISGQITLNFPTAEWIVKDSKQRQKPRTYDEAVEIELKIKQELTNQMEMAAGTINSTPEQQKTAINLLFGKILALRNGDRIKGIFMDEMLEARIRRLEEGLEKVNNLIEEIVEWIYKGVVDK